MDWNSTIGLAGAVTLAGLAVAREWIANRGLRSRIRQDVELLHSLPENSAVADALEEHIDTSIRRLIDQEQILRRDPVGTGLAIAFGLAAIWTGYQGIDGTDAWFGATAVLGVFALIGFGQSYPKRHRDERGREIKPPPS